MHLRMLGLLTGIVLLGTQCRVGERSGPVARTFDEVRDEVNGLEQEETSHFKEIGSSTDAISITSLEDAHWVAVDTRVERMMRHLQWVELCTGEGESRETPWLAELLGRTKEEAKSHLGAMQKVTDVEAATAEEGRHQRAMEVLLKDLWVHSDEARADERLHRSQTRNCPPPEVAD